MILAGPWAEQENNRKPAYLIMELSLIPWSLKWIQITLSPRKEMSIPWWEGLTERLTRREVSRPSKLAKDGVDKGLESTVTSPHGAGTHPASVSSKARGLPSISIQQATTQALVETTGVTLGTLWGDWWEEPREHLWGGVEVFLGYRMELQMNF